MDLSKPRFGASGSDWKSWKWHINNRLEVNEKLSEYFKNIPSAFFQKTAVQKLNLSITPYMLSKMDPAMNMEELKKDPWFLQFFSLGKNIYEQGYDAFDGRENWDLKGEFPTRILQHKYPNRVLLYAPVCLAYCNFCFKANEQLDKTHPRERIWTDSTWASTLDYIKNTPGIEELVFSGGDPLFFDNDKIDQVFTDIEKIRNSDGSEKIFLKRIHTRALTHVPYRITKNFVHILKKHNINQLIFNVAHPSEITEEFKEAVYIIREGMAGQGIMLAMHTPFLRGVNDNAKTLWQLFSTMGRLSIKPYYLIATFPHTPFADQQRVSVKRMMEIMDQLRREKSPAYLPTPIVPHPERKIILPYYSTKQINKNGNPYLEATELNNSSPKTYSYPDAKD